jgi:hypothetical protein
LKEVPPYISDPDFSIDENSEPIDSELVDKLCQFSFKRERVMEALTMRQSQDKGDQKVEEFTDLRIIQVTYKILAQGKKKDKKPSKTSSQ